LGDSHEYRVIAWWASGRTGLAKSDSAPNSIHFTAPPQFGGLEGRWTPEDLLLCAIASCFTTTFRVLAENSKWEYTELQVEAAGTVDKADSGYSFSHIILRLHLKILAEPERARAFHLLQQGRESVPGFACPGGDTSIRARGRSRRNGTRMKESSVLATP
jgi:organic hydroperoxide reductase OsmC/OhrA